MSENRRIAKNTLILYARSLVMMAIGIFTSRILLQAVGVENFGIYGIVGSVVGMFTILNGVLSAGSSRFLTFELGRKDPVKLRQTFNASFAMHCGMAVGMLLLFETVGLWFVNHKLNIPAGREFAAHVVYQLSIVSCLLSITQVPYGAVIVAHEKFDIYAYVGIAEVLFKFALPLAMLYIPFGDKLIAYGIICTVWSVGLQIFYRVYCHRRFLETHLRFCRQKSIYKSMLGYSLWDVLGSFCATGNSQGLDLLINLFFGVKVNAARSLATTVDGKVTQFNGQFMTSVVPQITKSYAAGNLTRFFELIYEAGKCSFYLLFILSLPLFLEADYLIHLWLVEVPPYTVLFLRCIIVYTLCRAPSRPIIVGVHATGDVKVLNLTSGLYSVGTFLPMIYLCYRAGLPVWMCYVVQIFNANICTVLEVNALWRKVRFGVRHYFMHVYFKSVLICALAVFPAIIPCLTLEPSLMRCALTGVCSVVPTALSVLWLGVSRETREKILAFASAKVCNVMKKGR